MSRLCSEKDCFEVAVHQPRPNYRPNLWYCETCFHAYEGRALLRAKESYIRRRGTTAVRRWVSEKHKRQAKTTDLHQQKMARLPAEKFLRAFTQLLTPGSGYTYQGVPQVEAPKPVAKSAPKQYNTVRRQALRNQGVLL